MKFSFFLIALLGFSAYTIDAIQWQIADDYEVRFDGSGAKGTFSNLRGTVIFQPDNLADSRMDVRVDVATIDTGNKTKDKHARSADWFDAEAHPHIRFTSQSFAKTTDGYRVRGTLDLHGTERAVDIPFTFEETPTGGLFVGSFTVEREDYGITGPWLRGKFVGSEFDIDLRVPVRE